MQTPLATYRVQFRPEFTFDDAAALAGYLAELGVSHLYCSPILQAAPGSTHGYDVVDHGRLNAELGGEEGYERLCQALAAAGLGQVVDIVPNHMATVGGPDSWWWDVLENGPSSRWAAAFDIDWDSPEQKLRERSCCRCSATTTAGCSRRASCGSNARAAASSSATTTTSCRCRPARSTSCWPPPRRRRLRRAGQPGHRPRPAPAGQRHRRRQRGGRHRDKEVLRSQLARLLEEQPDVAKAVDAAVAAVNAEPDDLHALLERQSYRLAFWRAAGQELGYRRFFDIPTLVGLRMENERVFDATHALVLDLVRDGRVDGLRVDHPDGLRDPAGYFRRLDNQSGGDAWIVAEKILEPGESLARAGRSPAPPATTSSTSSAACSSIPPARRR